MTRLTHSHSALKMFENCPKNYYHQRVERRVKDEGNAVTAYGERIHKALELRLSQHDPLPQEAAGYERLCAAIEAMVADAHALDVEYEMTLNDRLEPTGWWDSDAWLRSKADVLVRAGHKAYLFDWKTGKRRPDFDQLEMFCVQVFLHFPEIQQVKASFVWLQDLSMDAETYDRASLPRLLDAILKKIARIESALENNVWPAKPSGLCRWCPCRPICEFAK